MKLSRFLAFCLFLIMSVCAMTVAMAQSSFGDIIQVPQNLTVEDAVFKISTWIMAVIIFIVARLSNKVPFLQKIPSKWLMALSVAIAVGFVLFKMGFTTGNQAILAFIGSSAFHELLKLFLKKESIPISQTSESNNRNTEFESIGDTPKIEG
jgi:uncharacterized membrane-anchored protein YitT (DUF2179 family)